MRRTEREDRRGTEREEHDRDGQREQGDKESCSEHTAMASKDVGMKTQQTKRSLLSRAGQHAC